MGESQNSSIKLYSLSYCRDRTITCLLASNILNKRTQASLMSAYAILDQSYKEYKNKLIELYGEEQHNEIIDAIVIEKAEDVGVRGSYLGTNCDLSLEKVIANHKYSMMSILVDIFSLLLNRYWMMSIT